MEERKGVVIFKLSAVGSKSEGVTPFLYVNKDNLIPIVLKGDNPFENRGMEKYDGKYIKASGEIKSNTLVISEVEVLYPINEEEKVEE